MMMFLWGGQLFANCQLSSVKVCSRRARQPKLPRYQPDTATYQHVPRAYQPNTAATQP